MESSFAIFIYYDSLSLGWLPDMHYPKDNEETPKDMDGTA